MPAPTLRTVRGTTVYDERQIPVGADVSLEETLVDGVKFWTVAIRSEECDCDAVGTPDLTTAGQISVDMGYTFSNVEEIHAGHVHTPEPVPVVEPEPEPAEPEPAPEPLPEPPAEPPDEHDHEH